MSFVTVRIKEWKDLLEIGELFNDDIYFEKSDEYFTQEMRWYCGFEVNYPTREDFLCTRESVTFRGYEFTAEMYDVVDPVKDELDSEVGCKIVAGQLIEVAIRDSDDTHMCVVQYNNSSELCFTSEFCSGLITHLDEDLSVRGDLLQVMRIWDKAETEVAWSLEVGNRELLWEREKLIEYKVIKAIRFGQRESYAYVIDRSIDVEKGDMFVVENYENRDEEEIVLVIGGSSVEIDEATLYIFPKAKRRHVI